MDTIVWNFYDTPNVFLNIYSSLKEDFRFIFYKNDNNKVENMSLMESEIKDNFIETSIINKNDNKVNYFRILLTDTLQSIFDGAEIIGINSDPNKVNFFYRSHIKKEITKFHLNNRDYFNDLELDKYFYDTVIKNNININVSNYILGNTIEENDIRLKLSNCNLIDLIIFDLINNLYPTFINIFENNFTDENYQELKDNINDSLLDLKNNLINTFMSNDENSYNLILDKIDTNNLSKMYDERESDLSSENLTNSNNVLTYIFKRKKHYLHMILMII